MQASRHFTVARWPTSLTVSSLLGTFLLVGIGIASYRAIPVPTGFTHSFGLAITLVLPVLLVFSLFSTVTGYVVSSTDLTIQRLFWASHISLGGLHRVFPDPSVCKGARRIIGNAGLFGFTGLYQSAQLGRFRLFATDLRHSVVLVLPDRTVVITPAAPEAFAAHIHHVLPGTITEPPGNVV
ncbi:Bacterial Pleckstrin homology domain-containing protein [Gammaproteobacteria bacterium]